MNRLRILLFIVTTLLVACDIEPRPMGRTTPAVVGGEPEQAPVLLYSYGCTSCHQIPRTVALHGNTGPSLDGWSQRRIIAGTVPNRPEELVTFIMDPQSVRPGSAMPDLGVSEEDARHIAAFLFMLE